MGSCCVRPQSKINLLDVWNFGSTTKSSYFAAKFEGLAVLVFPFGMKLQEKNALLLEQGHHASSSPGLWPRTPLAHVGQW